MIGLRADRGAHVEHDGVALERRPKPGDRRTLDARHGVEVELRHRHQRAGVSSRDRDVRIPLLHGVEREPHRGLPAALPQGLAWLRVHLDHDIGVHDARSRLEPIALLHQRPDGTLVAEKDELALGMARERKLGARDDDSRTEVAPHSIERNSDLLGHRFRECPDVGDGALLAERIAVRRSGTKCRTSRSYFLTVLFFCSAASAAKGWPAGSAAAFGASKATPGLRG